MKNYINFVQLLGHLGTDPEIQSLSNGNSMVRINLATNEPYRDKDGNYQTKTQWHRLVAFGGLADNMATKLAKGNQVLINGRIENNSWENKDGVRQYGTSIIIREYMLLEKKKVEPAEVS